VENNIIHIKTCNSSNAECRNYSDLLEKQIEFCLYTDFQTNGKGNRGNSWFSNPQKNLLASFVKYPLFLTPDMQFYISMASSLAVCNIIDKTGLKTRIKWPNDIWVDNKKLGGLLIENQISNLRLVQTVIGIGINVHERCFPKNLPNPVSLYQLGIQGISVKSLITELRFQLNYWFEFLELGKFDEVKTHYLSHLMGYKELMKYSVLDDIFEAYIIDVNQYGYLVLEHSQDGSKHEYEMKQIRLIY
jgi:BirA family transcriptional regulator, biotin operon repressor / biotin---[acetyl-CoA-carboxylase] ligase